MEGKRKKPATERNGKISASKCTEWCKSPTKIPTGLTPPCRKAIASFTRRDYVTDGTFIDYHRAFQPVKRNGENAKRQPRVINTLLRVYDDGSRRFYKNGVLAYERLTDARRDAELDHAEAIGTR